MMRTPWFIANTVMLALAVSTASAGVSTIPANTTLNPGSFIYSPNGQYKLVMQSDGNLVSYAPNGQAQWLTHTQGHPNARAVMQSDGNFVIYDPSNVAIYLTHTQNQPTNLSFASYQNDGDFLIMNYQASWATNTVNSNQPASASANGILTPGTQLNPNNTISSGNGVFTLTMQGDGNLVLTSSGGFVQWASYTAGAGNYAAMQSDGNFVVYNAANQAVWSSNTAHHYGSVVVLQDDGNLVLYTPVPIYSLATGPINNANVTASIVIGRSVFICQDGRVVAVGTPCPQPPPNITCYIDDQGRLRCPGYNTDDD